MTKNKDNYMDELAQETQDDLISAIRINKRDKPDFSIDAEDNSISIFFVDPEGEVMTRELNKNITLMYYQPNKGKTKISGIKISNFSEIFGDKISQMMIDKDHRACAIQLSSSIISASKKKLSESDEEHSIRLNHLSTYLISTMIGGEYDNDEFLNTYASRFSASSEYIPDTLLTDIVIALSTFKNRIPSYHSLFYNSYEKILNSGLMTPEEMAELDPGAYVRSDFSAEHESVLIDNHFDILILNKRYEAIDDILKGIWVNTMPSVILIAYLKSTFGAKRFLLERVSFYNKVKSIFQSRGDKKSLHIIKSYE